MKDKNLMLFGLDGKQSSLMGIGFFLFIYFGATLFAAVLTPLLYWLVEWVYSIDQARGLHLHISDMDLKWLLSKGVDDFFDRIRYVPILVGLPYMMKKCGLFSWKYIGLSLTKANIKKFLRYFFWGMLTASAIFFLQYQNAQKPTDELNLTLPPDSYKLEISSTETSQTIDFKISNIRKDYSFVGFARESSSESVESTARIEVSCDSKNLENELRSVKIYAPKNYTISSLKNSKNEKLQATNIRSKESGFAAMSLLILKSFLGGILGAILVALIEEILFRGLIFRSGYTAWGGFWGVIFVSAFFAYKHFHVPSSIWQNIAGSECHAEWYTGFVVAYYDTFGVFLNFDAVQFTSLFLFSCVLCLVYMMSRVLWGSIGFHAGIVATIFTYGGSFFVKPNAAQKYFYGNEELSNSVFSIFALGAILVVFLIVYLRARKKAARRGIESLSE